jgi:hypothetical protein
MIVNKIAKNMNLGTRALRGVRSLLLLSFRLPRMSHQSREAEQMCKWGNE